MDIEAVMRNKAEEARKASRKLGVLSTRVKNKALLAMADVLEKRSAMILSANEQDLEDARQKGLKRSYLDRLMLNETRIQQMAEGLRQTAALPDQPGNRAQRRRSAEGHSFYGGGGSIS